MKEITWQTKETDISYIETNEGWHYLTTIKDIFTKIIVGWPTADNMKTELCMKALNNAVMHHRPSEGQYIQIGVFNITAMTTLVYRKKLT